MRRFPQGKRQDSRVVESVHGFEQQSPGRRLIGVASVPGTKTAGFPGKPLAGRPSDGGQCLACFFG
jgi:hypothetical protein